MHQHLIPAAATRTLLQHNIIMLLVRVTGTHCNDDNKGRKDIQQSTKVSLETFAGPPANLAAQEKNSHYQNGCVCTYIVM